MVARGTLTHERIIAAALVLVERDGAGTLTMRALGQELGVEAMSLYGHVPNRDAVLDGIGEALMSRLRPPAADASGAEACAGFARQLRAITLEHPHAFRLIGLRPLAGPVALAPVEALVGHLVGLGHPPADALGIYRAVASYARGYALAEVTGFTVDASTAAGRAPLDALPPEAFPVLAGRGPELAGLTAAGAFDAGLEAMLAGTRWAG